MRFNIHSKGHLVCAIFVLVANYPLRSAATVAAAAGVTRHDLGTTSDLIDRQLALEKALNKVEMAKRAINESRSASTPSDLALASSIFPGTQTKRSLWCHDALTYANVPLCQL